MPEDQYGDIRQSLGNLHAKVDMLLAADKDKESRVRTVEKKMWWATGASACVAFAASRLGLPGLH